MPAEPLNIQQINKTEKKEHLVLHRDSLKARVSVGLAGFSVVVQSVLGCSIFCCFCFFVQCERLICMVLGAFKVHLPQSLFSPCKTEGWQLYF